MYRKILFSNLNLTEFLYAFLSMLNHFLAIKKCKKTSFEPLGLGGGGHTLVVRSLKKNYVYVFPYTAIKVFFVAPLQKYKVQTAMTFC